MSDIMWRPARDLTPEIAQRSRMLVELVNGDIRLCLRGADVCNADVEIAQFEGAWRLTVLGDARRPVRRFAVIDDW